MELYQASAVGVFRTILIIVFVIVVLRFLGKMLIARRNIQEQHNLNARKKAESRAKEEAKRNYGKVKISKPSKDAEDIDYEEV